MGFTYKTRRRLRSLGRGLTVLCLLAVAALLLWLIWVGRYMVYSRDGAHLDFSQVISGLSGQLAVKPDPAPTVSILFNDGSEEEPETTQMQKLLGYYLTLEDLQGDMTALMRKLQGLDAGTAVMVDLKNGRGQFYYSSKISTAKNTSKVDKEKIDSMISWLKSSGLYVIGRIPSFQDRNFALYHHNNKNYIGIPLSSGALWVDGDNCYWVNPAKSDTQAYLVQLATELRELGFDEIIFDKFYFPQHSKIKYSSKLDQEGTLTKLAQTLVDTCSTDRFTVSFQQVQEGVTLPTGRTRLYLENVDADEAAKTAGKYPVADPAVNLVFFAQTNDTRYEEYGVLRPIENVG